WVARAVVYGFDLGADRGFDLLRKEYNPRCHPPWSEAELRHKCKEADERPFDKPRGWLLTQDRSGWNPNDFAADGGSRPAPPPPQPPPVYETAHSWTEEWFEDRLHGKPPPVYRLAPSGPLPGGDLRPRRGTLPGGPPGARTTA